MIKVDKIYNKSTAVVILAAGLSSRMGIPKPFLEYNNRLLFIDKIIGEYNEFGCIPIIITISDNPLWKDVIDRYQSFENINFVENHHLEYERFYSVKLGIANVGNVDYCFVQNTDNPFVNQDILSEIYNYKTNDGYIVPTCKGIGGHPILLSKNVMTGICMENNNSNLKNVLQGYERVECNVNDEIILVNINIEQDYLKYFMTN